MNSWVYVALIWVSFFGGGVGFFLWAQYLQKISAAPCKVCFSLFSSAFLLGAGALSLSLPLFIEVIPSDVLAGISFISINLVAWTSIVTLVRTNN